MAATKTVVATPEPVGTAALGAFLTEARCPEASLQRRRKLLELAFGRAPGAESRRLSQKARASSLTPTERAELDEFIRVADLLAILQSRARPG